MKTILLGTILAIVVVFFLFPNTYAEKSSLKQQLVENLALAEISCPNYEHVLIQRSNEKLACVNPILWQNWNGIQLTYLFGLK